MDTIRVAIGVLVLMGFRALFILIGMGVYELVRPHLSVVPSGILAGATILILISVTGTWQWQIEAQIEGKQEDV